VRLRASGETCPLSPAPTALARLSVALLIVAVAGCWREDRAFRPMPESAEAVRWTRQSELVPGPERPELPDAAIRPAVGVVNGYEENAYALSEGKRLFSAFNCVGCHANGGGGMGPALIDDKWTYGSRPEQVFATIIEGRPNGMPSWGGRIPEYQVWWLVAYVRSLGGLTPSSAATGRADHMRAEPPENSRGTTKPVNSGVPHLAEVPK
jgi:cytochrome c oxidase cbb3-type subunit 3